MFELLFGILFIMVFGRLLMFAIRMAWGILRVVISLVLLPLSLIWFVFSGLIKLALPILIVVGIISLFTADKRRIY